MKIIPAIDIRDGKCVRLAQGDYRRETIYGEDPVFMAMKWESEGAKMLHVVDLDGAKTGRLVNLDEIVKIINYTQIPIQMGGGIRTLDAITALIDIGVSRVILGTVALENNDLLVEALSKYGDKIIVSLDVRGELLMKKGWTQKSKSRPLETIKNLESLGLENMIYTDTTKDGMLTEPDYFTIKKILDFTKMKIIIAGGISTQGQIGVLKNMGVDGVILGKAIYENRINLKEVPLLC